MPSLTLPGHIPVYIRGGAVLATQQPAMTTRDARLSPWSLLVALGVDRTATGRLEDDVYPFTLLDTRLMLS